MLVLLLLLRREVLGLLRGIRRRLDDDWPLHRALQRRGGRLWLRSTWGWDALHTAAQDLKRLDTMQQMTDEEQERVKRCCDVFR